MKFNLDDIRKSKVAHLNGHLLQPANAGVKNRHKYGADPVEIDGHKFPSKKEARRYIILRRDQVLGLIKNLRIQVPYELNEGGTHSLKYIADFVYTDVATDLEIVEDAKGYRTREYKKKKRLMLEIYKIKIKEV